MKARSKTAQLLMERQAKSNASNASNTNNANNNTNINRNTNRNSMNNINTNNSSVMRIQQNNNDEHQHLGIGIGIDYHLQDQQQQSISKSRNIKTSSFNKNNNNNKKEKENAASKDKSKCKNNSNIEPDNVSSHLSHLHNPNNNNNNKIHHLSQFLVLSLNLTSSNTQKTNASHNAHGQQPQSQSQPSSSNQKNQYQHQHQYSASTQERLLQKELQLQNYRLIETNYQMIEKNTKLYETLKKYLLDALNFIQDFSYAEGVRVIYQLLNYMKGIEKGDAELSKQMLMSKYKNYGNYKDKEEESNLKQSQDKINSFKLWQRLKHISSTNKFDYIPQPKVTFQIFNKPVLTDYRNLQQFHQYDHGYKREHEHERKNRSFDEGIRTFESQKIIDKRREANFYQNHQNQKSKSKFKNNINKNFNINLFKSDLNTQSVESIVDTYSERQESVSRSNFRQRQNQREQRQVSVKKTHQIVYHKTSRTANEEAYRMMLVQANVIQSLHSRLFENKGQK